MNNRQLRQAVLIATAVAVCVNLASHLKRLPRPIRLLLLLLDAFSLAIIFTVDKQPVVSQLLSSFVHNIGDIVFLETSAAASPVPASKAAEAEATEKPITAMACAAACHRWRPKAGGSGLRCEVERHRPRLRKGPALGPYCTNTANAYPGPGMKVVPVG